MRDPAFRLKLRRHTPTSLSNLRFYSQSYTDYEYSLLCIICRIKCK